jgi:hypothetical protein
VIRERRDRSQRVDDVKPPRCCGPFVSRASFAVALVLLAGSLSAQTVRIVQKPEGLVHGRIDVPVVATDPVVRIAFFINGIKYTEAEGKIATAQVRVGEYIRRMRIRAIGYDAEGHEAGQDEMVVNDPQPPFRVHLTAPATLPTSGPVTLGASLVRPASLGIAGVDFFVGEEKVASLAAPPYEVRFDAAAHATALYARVVARASTGDEANDVVFFGDRPSGAVEVTLQQVPVSVATGAKPLRIEDLTLIEDGAARKIESLVPAADQPLYVVLLIDYSESML